MEARKLRIQLSKLGSENDGTIKSWDLTELGVFDFEFPPQNRYFDGVWFRPIRVTTGFPLR